MPLKAYCTGYLGKVMIFFLFCRIEARTGQRMKLKGIWLRDGNVFLPGKSVNRVSLYDPGVTKLSTRECNKVL